MTIATLREVLLWCAVTNYGVLLWWVLLFTLAHDWVSRLHSRWFCLPPNRFDAIHHAGIAQFKVGILVFNLVPYLALGLVR